MKLKTTLATLLLCSTPLLYAQRVATIKIDTEQAGEVIPKEIYGQFAEHLGTCIYGGLWVGPNSKISNIDGYRTDVLNALKELSVPVLRWPGGCFADEYHWMDGVGPQELRPTMVNNNWGGTIEDNSFGTHEFLNLCEMLDCEPYISGNVGSGTVEELAKWVEYMTSNGNSPMANLRRKNGREKAWDLKYIGVGNESWGCGGAMRPEYYADLYRRYSTYCRNYDGNILYKIASGANDYDYNWTDVLMSQVGNRMDGLSLHYYSVLNWNNKGSATEFIKEDYYATIGKCLEIESLIRNHCEIMDKYDKSKSIALILDEWGTWWDTAPGTNPGHLFQQNTLRDAFVASLSFDIFHKYTDRLKMANIAQIVNVLQSMILTKEDKMVLTPTYHVFKMYKVHQDAITIPLNITCDTLKVRNNRVIPMLSATASKDENGVVHISMSNIDCENQHDVTIDLGNLDLSRCSGEIITSANITDHNTFDESDIVTIEPYSSFELRKDKLVLKLPSKSIITLSLK